MKRSYGTKTLDDNEAAVYITGPTGKIIGHTGIAKFCKTAEEENAVTQANADMAARIAACLNACEGFDTAILEQHNLFDAGYAAEVRQFELTSQRDELLAALEYMVANIGQPASLETRDGFEAARAVVAKVGSQTKGAADAARRISACISACAGISTPVLEKGRISSDAFQLKESRADAAERKCDDLLAALEDVLGVPGIRDKIDSRALQVARAAIAKAKGGAS